MGFTLAPRPGRAQEYSGPANSTAPHVVPPDTARIRRPTAAKHKKAAQDSLRRTEKVLGFRVTRPAKAGYLALVPGLGQVYNHRWWKMPGVYAALGTTIGFLIYEQRGLNEYSNAANLLTRYPLIRAMAFPNPSLGTRGANNARSADEITYYLESFRHYRDGFIFYTAATYGLQALDAIVDAHLQEFDVSDDLALRWEPALLPIPGLVAGLSIAPGVAVALHFK